MPWTSISTAPLLHLAGPLFIDHEPLVSDSVLRKVPDLDTRNAIVKAATLAVVARDPAMRAIIAMRDECTRKILQVATAANVISLDSRKIDHQVKAFRDIERLAKGVIAERCRREKLTDDQIYSLLERWLLLRFDVWQQIEQAHDLGRVVVRDGIIKDKRST